MKEGGSRGSAKGEKFSKNNLRGVRVRGGGLCPEMERRGHAGKQER